MRTGVLLPTFEGSAERALRRAADAERAGVDGVFCYDHLWPIGQPERPALAPFPVLAAVAVSTARLVVGTLVARVGLVPDDVLVSQFDALAALAPRRVIAGMGTGDRLSAGENEAYGLAFSSAADRREALRRCAAAAARRGLPVWIGDGSAATRRIAAAEGAVLNLWDATPEVVAEEARRAEVTWAGPAPADLEEAVARLADAGATWVVFAGRVDLERLAAAGADAMASRRPAR